MNYNEVVQKMGCFTNVTDYLLESNSQVIEGADISPEMRLHQLLLEELVTYFQAPAECYHYRTDGRVVRAKECILELPQHKFGSTEFRTHYGGMKEALDKTFHPPFALYDY